MVSNIVGFIHFEGFQSLSKKKWRSVGRGLWGVYGAAVLEHCIGSPWDNGNDMPSLGFLWVVNTKRSQYLLGGAIPFFPFGFP